MVKSFFSCVLLLLATQLVYAQNEGFVVHEYPIPLRYPQGIVVSHHYSVLALDMDDDGIGEFKPEAIGYKWAYYALNVNHSTGPEDTLLCAWKADMLQMTNDLPYYDESYVEAYFDPRDEKTFSYVAVRKNINGVWYWGWAYVFFDYDGEKIIEFGVYPHMYVYKTAMCTIPNRHIYMGQTSLADSIPSQPSVGLDRKPVWVMEAGKRTLLRCEPSTSFTSLELYDLTGRKWLHSSREDIISPVGSRSAPKLSGDIVDLDMVSMPFGVFIAVYRLEDGRQGAVKIFHLR